MRAAILIAPPVAAFALVAGFEVAEAFGFQPLSAQPANVSEAAAMGAAAAALRFIADKARIRTCRVRLAPGVLGTLPRTVDAIDAAILGRRPGNDYPVASTRRA